MKKILLILTSIILLTSCGNKTEVIVLDKFSEFTEFTIGSGGGFSGLYTEYIIKDNGEVQKIVVNEAGYELGSLSSDSTIELFLALNELNPMNVDQNRPGNMNYYIKVELEGAKNTIQWSDELKKNEAQYKTFYDLVIKNLKSDGLIR